MSSSFCKTGRSSRNLLLVVDLFEVGDNSYSHASSICFSNRASEAGAINISHDGGEAQVNTPGVIT